MNTYIFFDFDKVITARELYEVRTHRTYECVNERESVSQLGGSHRIHTLNIFFRLIVNQGGILHILSKNHASHIKTVLKHTNLIKQDPRLRIPGRSTNPTKPEFGSPEGEHYLGSLTPKY